ncbi:hypothetical protein B2G63_19580 [Pseudomonas aeruginosa]|nr:hypothetical protein B2G63_19580 [Pseudomonas aeruginosa]
MREYQRLKGFTDNLELRRRNRATVEHYMRMKGAERLQRHSLFVEDGCAGNWTTDNREFMNPMQKLRALGIAVPQIKRDGIPT